MTAKIRPAGIVLSLLVLVGLILLLARPGLDPARINPIVLVGAAWIVFGFAAWLVRKLAVRLAVVLILAGGIAVQVVALTGPPQNSSDLYRYIWDGRVQAAGIDPYLYAPVDAGVAKLRNDFLWTGTGSHHYVDCVPNREDAIDPADTFVAGCTKLNRPRVPTVYPPVAEAYFFAVQMIAPADNSTTPVQVAAAMFAVAVTLILLFGMRKLGKDPRLVALWAWCPTVALEAGQNGHVDVVGVALATVALLLLAGEKTERRTIFGGVLIGLAIATKVTPVLVVPAVLRRGWFLISASVVAAISLVYAPHVMAVGSKIIGFFPGYLSQEGYSTGSGFSVIGLFVHGKLALLAAVVILGAIALAILRFGNPDEPWRGGVLMTAAALAVTTPDFQWYAILLVMLVALDGTPEWLVIAAGGYLANSPDLRIDGFTLHHHSRLIGYGGGAAIACACALVRYFLTRRAAMAAAESHTAIGSGVTGSDAGSAADAAAVSSETPAGSGNTPADVASEADEVDVVEPTAIYPKSAVSVTIGTNGTPEFASDGESTSLGSTPGRFPRIIRLPRILTACLPGARYPNIRPTAPVNRNMSYQDPPQRQRLSRYSALAQYEDINQSYRDTQAGRSQPTGYPSRSGDGYRGGYSGFAGRGTREERAPWDDPTQRSQWDTTAQDSADLPRRASGPFFAIPDDEGGGSGRRRRGRGRLAGSVAGFLAAAVAIGVANLVAAFVRPQASPVIAVGGWFIDHTPPWLKNFAVQKFGENDKNMLLLGMYVTIAIIAIMIGMLAWRRIGIGVAGIGLFGLFGAYIAITRPENHVTDVIPSIAGGIAGIATIVWLVRMGAARPSGAAWNDRANVRHRVA